MIAAAALLTVLAGMQVPATPHVEAADIDLAVRVCDTWLSNPATWADHIPEFPERSGLDQNGLRPSVTLPRFAKGITNVPAAHFWSLKTGNTAIAIVTSDVRPWCTFAIGDVAGASEASAAWISGAGQNEKWSVGQSSTPAPPGMNERVVERPKDGTMPARLLVFSTPTTPKASGNDLQLLATEALQLD